ncbi:LPD7 domain-containing protein [Massilia scottii]|uniref:LPD7 domain-containing protein n=1 Tax=Massilia scottii TaxID=3057166 RepID=UPI0027964D32|nr:LPD7 domain-containing protein [Massilia sp. CCM 9029]MDQ1829834.1 LPD7 domain-containing protein [Massilia sp. CCM 9029]
MNEVADGGDRQQAKPSGRDPGEAARPAREDAPRPQSAEKAPDRSGEAARPVREDVSRPQSAEKAPERSDDAARPGRDDAPRPQSGEKVTEGLGEVRKQFLEGKKYYYPDKEDSVAFEDKGSRLETKHNDPAVVRSMVDVALDKEWKTIKVSGADEFKRSVWLEASTRGLQVEGYKPTDVDLAMLKEQRQERGIREPAAVAPEAGERAPRNSRADAPAPGSERSQPATPEAGSRDKPGSDEKQRPLTPKQQLAIDVLTTVMSGRGDSDKAVQMATKLAADMLRTLSKETDKPGRGEPVVNRYDRDADKKAPKEAPKREASPSRSPERPPERQAQRQAEPQPQPQRQPDRSR